MYSKASTSQETMENSNDSTMNSQPQTPLPEHKRKNKQVSFGLQQTAYFASTVQITEEERKSFCWYSDSELQVSRDEARRSIHALQDRLREEDSKGNSSDNVSIDSLVIPCPHEGVVCLRGIEKYADAAAKYAGQKRHVGSVLHHYASGSNAETVALIAQTLSQPFKDVAHYYAIKNAEEEASIRKQEEQERQQVASAVLFLLVNGGKKQPLVEAEATSPLKLVQVEDGRRTPPEMVSTSTKRSREASSCCGEKESSFCRNVKPCLQIITE